MALVTISPSIYQMGKSGFLIFSSLFAICFLKRKLDAHHTLGMITVLIGIIFLFVYVFSWKMPLLPNLNRRNIEEGMIFFIVGIFMHGIYYTTEEKLFINYKVDPLTMIIWEGIFGLLISLSLLFFLNFVLCSSNN